MRQVWEPEDLLASRTLLDADWELVANKSGATRLGFALLLKFFEIEARFPRDRSELPAAAVAFVADQVGVPAGELGAYDWAGRSIKYHRAQVRDAFGFRESTVADEQRWAAWLQDGLCPSSLAQIVFATRCCAAAEASGSSRRVVPGSNALSAQLALDTTPCSPRARGRALWGHGRSSCRPDR
jgi:hypothetical protein